MWKVISFTLILIVIATALTIYRSLPNQSKNQKTDNSPIQNTQDVKEESNIEVIAQNLDVPWALAFLPNKNILFTERKGFVKLIDNGSIKEIAKIEVKQEGESGLHGIAIHPKYPEQPYVYLYYTYAATTGENSLNKISQFTFDGQTLKEEVIIVDKIPGAIFHDGGRIKFGPDGYLYITTGDATNPSLSQDKNSLAGKILKVSNPLKTPTQVETYSYGHRNPQGITWDDMGQLWETEHGPSTKDEVNLIEKDKNYGWPTVTGEQTKPGIVSPKIQSSSNTWAPAGVAHYKGSLFFGGLRGQALFELNTQTLEIKEHFKEEFGRIRDVVLGPDNSLYITTSNKDGRGNPKEGDDKIIKIDPEKL